MNVTVLPCSTVMGLVSVSATPSAFALSVPPAPSTLKVTGYLFIFHCAVYSVFMAGNAKGEGGAGDHPLKA